MLIHISVDLIMVINVGSLVMDTARTLLHAASNVIVPDTNNIANENNETVVGDDNKGFGMKALDTNERRTPQTPRIFRNLKIPLISLNV